MPSLKKEKAEDGEVILKEWVEATLITISPPSAGMTPSAGVTYEEFISSNEISFSQDMNSIATKGKIKNRYFFIII
jgi:hypothetical protein